MTCVTGEVVPGLPDRRPGPRALSGSGDIQCGSDQTTQAAEALGLTGTEKKLLPTLSTGQGLWRIKDRSFLVQHQLHPTELKLFDTTARMNTRVPELR